MKINKKLGAINRTQLKRTKSDIQWIVIHYVGALGDARANAEYYASTYVGASADFFVGHTGDIWQGNDYYSGYSWHCGGGYQSSWTQHGGGMYYGKCTNKNSIGIEMCVHKRSTRTMNATDDDWYFEEATIEATAALTAQLMKELDIDIEHVIMHHTVNRKVCPSPFVLDYSKWLDFKTRVAFHYSGAAPAPVEPEWYRVGLAWEKGKCTGQLGAYEILDNAKANCPVGYHVFDSKGKIVYTAEKTGTQAAEIAVLSEKEAAARILEMARAEGNRSGILPSIIAAQAILESGYCRTELARKANNIFGMKCSLSGNTWKSVWDGESKVTITTAEEYTPGVISYINADFRKYDCLEKSLQDHSCYLLGATNGSKLRYAGLTGCTSYRTAIQLIKDGGYATDSQYVSKICNIIERYSLDKYDGEVKPSVPTIYDKYVVRKTIDDEATQQGAFHVLKNAEARADRRYGYKVYDLMTGECVYTPNKSKAETYALALEEMAEIAAADIASGIKWVYSNSGKFHHAKTFDLSRENKWYAVNCVEGCHWGQKRAGTADSSALSWYGGKGKIRWIGANAEANAQKEFEIIPMNGRRVDELTKAGLIKRGDIVTYTDLTHTNAYLGGHRWFDTGHVNCKPMTGEGVPFLKWICGEVYGDKHVAFVFRLREPEKTGFFRVQVGCYSKKSNADAAAKALKKAGLDSFQEKDADGIHVYCGSFLIRKNAEDRLAKVKAAGYKTAYIKEFS